MMPLATIFKKLSSFSPLFIKKPSSLIDQQVKDTPKATVLADQKAIIPPKALTPKKYYSTTKREALKPSKYKLDGYKKQVLPRGDITDHSWKQVIINESGRMNHTALDLLAYLTYWYRTKHVICENTGKITGYTRKFGGDFLQKNYKCLQREVGASRWQLYRAIILLEKLGLVQRHFKHLEIPGRKVKPYVMYLELKLDELEKITNIEPVNDKKKSKKYTQNSSESNKEKIQDKKLDSKDLDTKFANNYVCNQAKTYTKEFYIQKKINTKKEMEKRETSALPPAFSSSEKIKKIEEEEKKPKYSEQAIELSNLVIAKIQERMRFTPQIETMRKWYATMQKMLKEHPFEDLELCIKHFDDPAIFVSQYLGEPSGFIKHRKVVIKTALDPKPAAKLDRNKIEEQEKVQKHARYKKKVADTLENFLDTLSYFETIPGINSYIKISKDKFLPEGVLNCKHYETFCFHFPRYSKELNKIATTSPICITDPQKLGREIQETLNHLSSELARREELNAVK